MSAASRPNRFSDLDAFLDTIDAIAPPNPRQVTSGPLPPTTVRQSRRTTTHGMIPSEIIAAKLKPGGRYTWRELGRRPGTTYRSQAAPISFDGQTWPWHFYGTAGSMGDQIARVQRMLGRGTDPDRPLGCDSLGRALRRLQADAPDGDEPDAWWIPASRLAWTLRLERLDDLRSSLRGRL